MAVRPATRGTSSTGIGWLSVPKDWVASLGDIIRFCGQSFGDIFNGRVFHFFGEALRQAGILILGSALVIWGMVFILGLQCGIEGAYFNRWWAHRPTRACSRPGVTCARWSPTCSATS